MRTDAERAAARLVEEKRVEEKRKRARPAAWSRAYRSATDRFKIVQTMCRVRPVPPKDAAQHDADDDRGAPQVNVGYDDRTLHIKGGSLASNAGRRHSDMIAAAVAAAAAVAQGGAKGGAKGGEGSEAKMAGHGAGGVAGGVAGGGAGSGTGGVAGGGASSAVRAVKLDTTVGVKGTQQDTCDRTGVRTLAKAALNGTDASLFVFGGRGSGKTHTLFGEDTKTMCAQDFIRVRRQLVEAKEARVRVVTTNQDALKAREATTVEMKGAKGEEAMMIERLNGLNPSTVADKLVDTTKAALEAVTKRYEESKQEVKDLTVELKKGAMEKKKKRQARRHLDTITAKVKVLKEERKKASAAAKEAVKGVAASRTAQLPPAMEAEMFEIKEYLKLKREQLVSLQTSIDELDSKLTGVPEMIELFASEEKRHTGVLLREDNPSMEALLPTALRCLFEEIEERRSPHTAYHVDAKIFEMRYDRNGEETIYDMVKADRNGNIRGTTRPLIDPFAPKKGSQGKVKKGWREREAEEERKRVEEEAERRRAEERKLSMVPPGASRPTTSGSGEGNRPSTASSLALLSSAVSASAAFAASSPPRGDEGDESGDSDNDSIAGGNGGKGGKGGKLSKSSGGIKALRPVLPAPPLAMTRTIGAVRRIIIMFIQCSEICTLRNEKFHSET